MNEKTNIQENAQANMVARDFLAALVVVSVTVNLAVFTTWLTVVLS